MWVVVLSAKQCSKLNKNMNTSDYCGAKGSRDSGPFHIKPKTHAEEEEVPEDERRESKLPGYTAEDDPVLGRPKSRKGGHCVARGSPLEKSGLRRFV